ncbi:GNAT family N-acetyltransferase [Pseudotabrizicola sp. 4114]|uniref:GNAT family N-acetyltransferase n=1 Tax=Pseudotabrizicola sp. 4114 TaxID=2817731 RepID=UPI00285EE56A|nr:GNAT superfamily N-acetyltransferase [Pseudorhodobacter sp. 4114]
MKSVTIHRAGQNETATVARFVHALLDELTAGAPPSLQDVTARAGSVLAGPGVIALIASVDAKPVGVMTLNECAAIYAGGRFGEISELYIRPDMRSQGIAKRLLDHAQAEGIARGWHRIEVGAPGQPEWHRTLAFYRCNGFTEVGPRLRRLLQDQ